MVIIRYYSTKEISGYIGNMSLQEFKSEYTPVGKHNHMLIFCYEDIIDYMNKYKISTKEFEEKHSLEDRKMNYIKFKEPELFTYTIYEDGTITKYDNTSITGSIGKHGYYEFGTNSSFCKILKVRLKHRVIAHALFGDISKFEVDHIDRNKLNNSFENIRMLDKSGNLLNRGKYKGHIIVTDIVNNITYVTDNIRLLERTFPLPVSNTHIYRILLGQFPNCKTTSVRPLLNTEPEYDKVKDMYNYAIKI